MVTQTNQLSWRALSRTGGIGMTLLICVSAGILFGLLALSSVELTRFDSRIAAVWVPSAVAVACLLRFRVAREHMLIVSIWIGNTAANAIGGDPVAVGAALAACNAIEIQLAVALARRWCGERPDMQDIGQLTRFVAGAAVVSPMLVAVLATLTLGAESGAFLYIWLKWAVTDALGMAIVAPSLMVIIDALRGPIRLDAKRLFEWCAVVLGGAIVTVAIFLQSDFPLLFLTAPIIVLHSFRLGAPGTAVGIVVTAILSIGLTSVGHGPVTLVDSSLTMRLIVLQTYLASTFLMGLPIAAMLAGRERAMADLAAKQQELALLANTITDAVLHYDNSGRCTYASPSVEAVLREGPGDLLGTPAQALSHEETRVQFEAIERQLLTGKSEQERLTFRRRRDDEDGRAIYVEADCAVARLIADGPASGIVLSVREITARVELELQLNRARRVAENAARGKTEFLANMSHEIRTPMNGVLGFAELLTQADLPAEQQRHAELIVQSGRSMMMLLNQILDLAKIESGHVTIEREPTDLGELISECARLHQASAQSKGLTLICDGPIRGPFINTDGLRLRQILGNLLSNAIKFTEHGSITLRHRVRDQRVLIEVQDTGIGILEDRMANIFEPFEQGESDTARRYGGTGLGLTISRQLAELLEGQLDVTSQPGRGSRFTISIPYEPADHRPEPEAAAAAGAVSTAHLQPSRILLAEDHDINRMLVTAMLERCGQSVSVARDGEEAIEAVLEACIQDRPFDLVLMDIQMPGCDGYSATRAIRAEGIRASQLPIIALTANAYPEDITAAREAGMQSHLAKPLAFASLVQTLQRWLPVRIVDEHPASAEPSPPASMSGTVHSPSLLGRWKVRRRETLDSVRAALQDQALSGDQAEALAKQVHTLAGTAGMFGENALGECAAALERALKTDTHLEERRTLAEQLLEIAARGQEEQSEPRENE